jgi:hypothetical protein
MSEQLNADRLVKIYVKIREKRLALEKDVAALQEQQDIVAKEILEICKEQGASTIRTEHGTISRRTSKRFWTSDWDAFFKFVKEQDAFALMQQRIHVANMEQFLEENPDLHPPGLNADATQTIVITKK